MEAPPSVELVVQAITSLYHSPDMQQKEQAGRWLLEFQQSVYAWTIADQLLLRKLDVETCYFAAQTMRSKIQSNFHELPNDSHESLRNSLLEHLKSVTGSTDSTIRTQLCLAMADLILLMPEWDNAIQELMQKLSSSNQLLPLLEVLMLLPEEVDSRHLRLGGNRRQQVKEVLQRSAPALSHLLQSCLAGEAHANNMLNVQILVIKCYSSWLTLGVVPLCNVQTSGLMHLALSILAEHNAPIALHDAATDCVTSLLARLEREDEPSLERSMYEALLRLEEPYQLAVNEEDMEKCLNYCRVFTELGESFLLRMVTCPENEPHFTLPILELVLLCCSHPDYDLPDITFNLWYRLSEELYTRNEDWLIQMFKPYVEKLILCLSRHCQMEPDTVGCLGEDDDFSEFRTKVSELIKDCVFIVGSSSVFRQMCLQLHHANQWEQTEAALFIMQSVARNILPEESEIVPQVLQQVLGLPPTIHQAVRVMATRLVGELAEWIEQHPDTLQAVLQHVLHGLQDPVLASEAATALQSICTKCRSQMALHFTGLLQILEQIDQFKLKPEPAKGLVKGVALIVSIMEKGQLEGAVGKICELQAKPLMAIMEQPRPAKVAKNSVSDPVLYLDRLSDVFRNVSPSNGCVVPVPHPCKKVVETTWPVLSKCCDVFADDERITERTCRTIRFAIRCIGVQSSGLLEPLVTQIVRLYTEKYHSCYLYLGSILVDEYAGEGGCIPGLLSMLQHFITPTYTLLARPDGLRNNPGTVDDFFRLNARFMQRAPLHYLQTEFLKSVVECALLSVGLEHREANASVMKFFYDLLRAGRTREQEPDYQVRKHLIGRLQEEYGERLLDTLIKSAVLTLPSYTYTDIGDVINELLLRDRAAVCVWLEASVQNLPQLGTATPVVTRKQMVEFHQLIVAAESSTDVSHALREFSRLWK